MKVGLSLTSTHKVDTYITTLEQHYKKKLGGGQLDILDTKVIDFGNQEMIIKG